MYIGMYPVHSVYPSVPDEAVAEAQRERKVRAEAAEMPVASRVYLSASLAAIFQTSRCPTE